MENKPKTAQLQNMMKQGLSSLGQNLNIFKASLMSLGASAAGGGGSEEKEKMKQQTVNNTFDLETDIITDPFFKKAQGLKKIIM